MREDRPRIWLAPEKLTWLKANVSRPQYQNLLRVFVNGWTKGGKADTRAIGFALDWQVRGNRENGLKAVARAQEIVDQGETALWYPSAKTLEGTRFVLPEVSVVYDWCYDLLTPEQRDWWAHQLIEWAVDVWPETNPARVGAWGVNDPGDNFYAGFLQSALAGYALAHTGLHDAAMGIVNLNRQKWLRLREYLEKYSGGYSLEGTNYGNWSKHFYYLAATATATDYDDFKDPTFHWPRQVAETFLHLTSPTRDRLVPFGEQSNVKTAPITDYHRTTPMILTSHGDLLTKSLMSAWLGWIKRERNTMVQTRWEEALWNAPGSWEFPAQMSTTHHVPEAGFVSVRTSWEEDANWLCFLCGPDLQSHQDHASGQFAIWSGGDWLTAPARLWGGSGLLAPTEFSNAILIEDPATGTRYGQPAQPAPGRLPKDRASAWVARQGGDYVVLEGEAPEAYAYWKNQKANQVLGQWTRALTFLKPEDIFVEDVVVPVSPAHRVLWQLHCEKEPFVSGSDFVIWGPRKNLKGRVFSPANTTIAVEPVLKGPKADGVESISSYRLLVVCPPASETLIVVRLRIE